MSDGASIERRFGGIARLYGDDGLQRFRHAHICVVGVGGVGSWVVESLARSGIGELTLIDMDHVAESNINRQLPALTETLGQSKIVAMERRISGINPGCRVNLIDDFIRCDNLSELLDGGYDAVIDCIDSYREKAALIAWCKRRKVFVVTVGGAGGKIDISKLGMVDLSRTEKDALLSRTRKELRQAHDFPKNVKRRFSVPAVFSTEEPIISRSDTGGCEVGDTKPSHLNCGGLGSVTHVTATAGFFAVSRVLQKISGRE